MAQASIDEAVKVTKEEVLYAITKMRSSLDHVERCVKKESMMSRGVGVALVTESAEIATMIAGWVVSKEID